MLSSLDALNNWITEMLTGNCLVLSLVNLTNWDNILFISPQAMPRLGAS